MTVLVILVLLSGNMMFQYVATISEHWGTQFVMSFLRSYSDKNIVVITTREMANVTLKFHETAFSQIVTIPANKSYRHVFDDITTAKPYMVVLKKKAVSIESNVKVYGFSKRVGDVDGYLALPVSSLGNEYIAVTMENKDKEESGKPQIVIVATENNTFVEIIFKSTTKNKCYITDDWSDSRYVDGYNLTLNMDANDVFNVYCFRDMTGTRVSSNTPIAVISGCKCISLPRGSRCNHIAEMLPPTSDFGYHFSVTQEMQEMYDVMFRVLALNGGTRLEIGENLTTLSANDFKNFYPGIHKDVNCFNASGPIQVTLFITGKRDHYRNSIYMKVLPPMIKLINDYIVGDGGNGFAVYEKMTSSISLSKETGIAPECKTIYYCGINFVQVTLSTTTTHAHQMTLLQCSIGGSKYGFPVGVRVNLLNNNPVTSSTSGLTSSSEDVTTTSLVVYDTTTSLRETTASSSETTTSSIETTVFSSETSTSSPETTASSRNETSGPESDDTTSSPDSTSLVTEMSTSPRNTTSLTENNTSYLETTTTEDFPGLTSSSSLKESNTLQQSDSGTGVTSNEQSSLGVETSSSSTSIFTSINEATQNQQSTSQNPLQTESQSTANVTMDNIASRYSTALPGSSRPLIQRKAVAMLVCPCPCSGHQASQNASHTQRVIHQTIEELILEKTNLSRRRRLKISVENVYQSESDIGMTSVLLLSVFVVLVVMYDLPIIVKDILVNFKS